MQWNWEPTVLAGVSLLAGGYLAAAGPLRARFRDSQPVEQRQMAAFMAGAAVILFALVSPLDSWGDHYLLTAHMVQHILLTLVAPPLLLMGTPGWMLQPALRWRPVARLARLATQPIVAFILFNAVYALWHAPYPYEAALENESLHIVEHLMFIATAVLNWWPILGMAPELPRLPYPAQVLYLFLDGLPMTILSAFIVFSPDVLYRTYAIAPRVFGLSAIDDQQLAGVTMWMPGGMIYLLALILVFAVWRKAEDQAENLAV